MKNYSENVIKEEVIVETKIHGFHDSMEVARAIMGSINENLLRGDLIFAYRSGTGKSTLSQIVVVNDLADRGGRLCPTDLYSVSIITAGYSAYIPHMPIDYLEEVVKELEDGKAEKKVIESFKNIIENRRINKTEV